MRDNRGVRNAERAIGWLSTLVGGSELAAASVCGVPRACTRAQLAASGALIVALAAPGLLWHDVLVAVLSEFRLDLSYVVSELIPWMLILAGAGFLVPVAWSAGADPEGRYYPRARRAYLGWGLTLYLLGLALAGMVAQLARLSPG